MNDSLSHRHAEAAEDLFFDARLSPQGSVSKKFLDRTQIGAGASSGVLIGALK